MEVSSYENPKNAFQSCFMILASPLSHAPLSQTISKTLSAVCKRVPASACMHNRMRRARPHSPAPPKPSQKRRLQTVSMSLPAPACTSPELSPTCPHSHPPPKPGTRSRSRSNYVCRPGQHRRCRITRQVDLQEGIRDFQRLRLRIRGPSASSSSSKNPCPFAVIIGHQ